MADTVTVRMKCTSRESISVECIDGALRVKAGAVCRFTAKQADALDGRVWVPVEPEPEADPEPEPEAEE